MPNPSLAISIDAPVGGWNAFDSIDNMPPTDAIILDNLIPSAGTVDTRLGSLLYASTGTGKPVETLADLDTRNTSKLIAASDGGIWDITDSEVEVQAKAVSELHPAGTFLNSRWQHANFRDLTEEGVLLMCNGVDPAQRLPLPYTALEPMVMNGAGETFEYDWIMETAADATDPATGHWITNTAQTILKVSWTDNEAIPATHQTELLLKVGTRIKLSDVATPTNYTIYEVTGAWTEGADFTEYPVVLIEENDGGATPLDQQTLFFDPTYIETNFIGMCIYKGRTYYWYDDDNSFWYAQAGSYQGLLTEFELGAIVQRGGKIVMMTTWTQQDSGDGKDDFLVIVMSTGEIVIYQGDDPETIGFFEMVGRYITAEPLSVRGQDKYGSDIIISTKDGYIALSTIVQQGRVSDVPAFSRLIHSAIAERTRTRGTLYGWDSKLFPKQGLFLFNVPLSETAFEQHVLNTVTQRWCRFKSLNANCLEVHDERLFGGMADGTVHALLEGTSDNGEAIIFTGLPAFNYLGDTGNHKFLTAAQVITTHSKPDLIELTGYADFNYKNLPPLPVLIETTVGIWSINPPSPASPVGSYWDEDYWGVGGVPFSSKGWQNVSAFGYAVSVLVRFAKLNESVSWRSTGIRFHNAGAQ